MEQSVPKRLHIKFRHRGIAQRRNAIALLFTTKLAEFCIILTDCFDEPEFDSKLYLLLTCRLYYFTLYIKVLFLT